MITAKAVIHGDRERLLGFDPIESPVILQLGGCDPKDLAEAARIVQAFGYDGINLNVGCPSDRVQSGLFGAALMREPARVADCAAAMCTAVRIPISIKCRLGVDDQDPQESLFSLVDACQAVGVSLFDIHARKAWLKGLSPKDNRTIPPLDYGWAYRVKQTWPDLKIILNGGLVSVEQAYKAMWGEGDHTDVELDGAMIGRAAYHNPALLGRVDTLFYGKGSQITGEEEALSAYRSYMTRELALGTPLVRMMRHMLGLFQGWHGARAWRRVLTCEAIKPGAGLEVLDQALSHVQPKNNAP